MVLIFILTTAIPVTWFILPWALSAAQVAASWCICSCVPFGPYQAKIFQCLFSPYKPVPWAPFPFSVLWSAPSVLLRWPGLDECFPSVVSPEPLSEQLRCFSVMIALGMQLLKVLAFFCSFMYWSAAQFLSVTSKFLFVISCQVPHSGLPGSFFS